MYPGEEEHSHGYSEAETDLYETDEGRNLKSVFLQRTLSNEYVLQLSWSPSGVYTNGGQPNADACQ